jgi:hypothetical protein
MYFLNQFLKLNKRDRVNEVRRFTDIEILPAQVRSSPEHETTGMNFTTRKKKIKKLNHNPPKKFHIE